MNTAAMNPAAAGGPVGGGMMMMSNGSPMHPAVSNDMSRINLNTYIYDYLLKHGHYDIARSILRDESFEFRKDQKTSPGRRKAGEMNGDGGDGMDMDQKDDVPDELPRPQNWDGSSSQGFLLEWFNVFNDLFDAARGRNGKPAAVAYMNYDKRLRESMGNPGMNRQAMNPALMQQRIMNGNIANQKMGPQQAQQAQQMMAMQKRNAAAQQMNREAGEGEMNGVRPGTPADGEAGGSPSKRPRIDNGQQQFNNGMIQNGRPAGAPGAQNPNMPLIQAGFNPNMNPQFRQNGMPPKSMQAGMQNGGMNMANAGSPMMAGMNHFPDGMNMNNLNLEYMRNQNMQNGQPGMQAGGGGAQSGNHALQDYQMQLMLLEQQNKKRLMMARQEQHENNPGGVPGVNMGGSGMSPGGSRTGTSPNPAEAMAGRSPAGMNFMSNFSNDLGPQMFNMGDKAQLMGPGPGVMRPPTSADINAVRQQPGARPGQFPGGHPMQQQGSQAGQIGTPGQREMPPPSAPATGGSAQRTQGASPSGNQAPPTPSQTNKPPPKNAKKGAANKDDGKRPRPNKKGGNANAASGDDNQPATPAAPSTPITPNNPGVMNANKGQPGMPQGNQQQPNPGMQMNNQMQQNDIAFNFPDSNDAGNGQFNLDFSTLESSDVLENFDFDSFLNTSADDAFNVDMSADFSADFGIGNTE